MSFTTPTATVAGMGKVPANNTMNNVFGAITGVAGIASAFGSIRSGKAQQTAYDINAQGYEMQGTSARLAAALNIVKMRKAAKTTTATQMSAYAGSNVLPLSGSPISVMVDSLANTELDIAIERYNGEMQAIGFQGQANQSRYAGKQAVNTGMAQAGVTLLKTAGEMTRYVSFGKTKIGH